MHFTVSNSLTLVKLTSKKLNKNMKFENICRLCLRTDENISNIFRDSRLNDKVSLVDRIYTLSSVQISENDELPSTICSICRKFVEDFYDFRAQIIETEAILRQCYSLKTTSSQSERQDDELQLLWVEEDGTQVFTLDIVQPEDETDSVIVLPVDKQKEKSQIHEQPKENSVVIIPRKKTTEPPLSPKFQRIEPSQKRRYLKNENCEVSCQLCLTHFPKYEQLQAHISAHFDGFIHYEPLKDDGFDDGEQTSDENCKVLSTCKYCLTKCERLDMHVQNKHADEKYVCKMCSEQYTEEDVFKKHVERNHSYLECSICSRKFQQYLELQSHLSAEHFEGAFWCTPCSKVFVQKYDFILHQRRHLGIRPFQCKFCKKRFVTITLCKDHERRHTKLSICRFCDKTFVRTADLKEHLKTIHVQESNPIVCSTCNKVFSTLSSYKLHAKRHKLGLRFVCSVCGKAYYANSELQRHVQIHSGVRKHPCDFCENSFLSQPELNRHLKYHKGEKLYKCDECGKSYYESGHLRIHQRSHSGIKPYECKVCSKRFVSGPKLMRHAKTHEQIKTQVKGETQIQIEIKDDAAKLHYGDIEMGDNIIAGGKNNVYGIQMSDGNIVLMENSEPLINENDLIYTSAQDNIKIEIINS